MACLCVLHCIDSGVDGPFVWFYDEIEYEKDLSTHLPRFDGQLLPELGLLLVVL